jgi:hypothetical protein
MKIDYAKEPNEADKNNLKEDIVQALNENFIDMILDMVNKMYRRHSRNSKTTKIENLKNQKKKPRKAEKHCINTKVKQRTRIINR